MHMSMNLEKEFKRRLEEFRDARKLTKLAELSGVEQTRLSKAISKDPKKQQQLGLDKVSKVLDALGARVIFPDQQYIDEGQPTNLPALIPPKIDSLPVAVDRIAQLEKQLYEKDQQIMELVIYKGRWLGLVESKKWEADERAREREQKSLGE